MMKIEITYCAVWHYTDRAVSLAAELLKAYEQDIETISLFPSDGGRFEVSLNGKLIYSKLNFLYGFQGLAEHKKQFEGHETIAYFCHAKKLPLIDILKLFRICNVV